MPDELALELDELLDVVLELDALLALVLDELLELELELDALLDLRCGPTYRIAPIHATIKNSGGARMPRRRSGSARHSKPNRSDGTPQRPQSSRSTLSPHDACILLPQGVLSTRVKCPRETTCTTP